MFFGKLYEKIDELLKSMVEVQFEQKRLDSVIERIEERNSTRLSRIESDIIHIKELELNRNDLHIKKLIKEAMDEYKTEMETKASKRDHKKK